MSTSQVNRVREIHAQNATKLSLTESDLSFETYISSVKSDKRTDGTYKTPADVQLEPTTFEEDRTSSIATDLPWKQQAQQGKTINKVNAMSFYIHTFIGYGNMYSQSLMLDTGCSNKLNKSY